MFTDYEIAQRAEIRPITDIASKLGLCPEDLMPYGNEIAKVNLRALDRPRQRTSTPRAIS